jgi:hypothetical protein
MADIGAHELTEAGAAWTQVLSDSFTQTRAIQVKYLSQTYNQQYWRFEGITPENGTDTRMATAELFFFGYGPEESKREGAVILTGVQATGEAADLPQAAYALAEPFSAEITGSAGTVEGVPTTTQFEITGVGATAGVGAPLGIESQEAVNGITELRLILSGKHLIEIIAPFTTTASPAGEVVLTPMKTFTVIRNIEVSFHNIGTAFWYYEITDTSPSSPTVKLYNASGSPVVQSNATISATIRGF